MPSRTVYIVAELTVGPLDDQQLGGHQSFAELRDARLQIAEVGFRNRLKLAVRNDESVNDVTIAVRSETAKRNA